MVGDRYRRSGDAGNTLANAELYGMDGDRLILVDDGAIGDFARLAFRLGFDTLGSTLLQQPPGLGLQSHPGTLLHKAPAGMLGLEWKERMRRAAGWRVEPALASR